MRVLAVGTPKAKRLAVRAKLNLSGRDTEHGSKVGGGLLGPVFSLTPVLTHDRGFEQPPLTAGVAQPPVGIPAARFVDVNRPVGHVEHRIQGGHEPKATRTSRRLRRAPGKASVSEVGGQAATGSRI
jgi:hypothetical protein